MRINFNAKEYLNLKKQAIKRFCNENKIAAIVLGISGGIDSAVVLGIYKQVIDDRDSYLSRVIPVIAPISKSESVSGQQEAGIDAKEIVRHFQCEENEFYKDLEFVQKAYLDVHGNRWSDGQLASVIRTPLMYYVASMSYERFGNNTIVSGTTNLSEGGYIGFYGKASDGMNDIQPIADILKSEVYAVAKELGIPEKFINRVPKGDVLDGLTDQELMNGVTYDELEENMTLRLMGNTPDLEKEYNQKIEALHTANRHKYRVGLPAHILNVIPVRIHDGWNYETYYTNIQYNF